MMLRLSIENVPSLASGDPIEVSLAEHGMVIGRAAHADWTLPDPNNHVSSVHCEVDFRDGRYFLTDRSTNGTFINGSSERLAKPVQLRDGDLLQIGHYQVRVEEVPDGSSAASGFGSGASGSPFGSGIDWTGGSDSAAKPISTSAFGREAARPMFQSSSDPLMGAFAPPRPAPAGSDPFGVSAAPPSPPAHDPFGVAAAPRATPAPDPFGLSAPPPAAANPFGAGAAPAAAPDPFGMAAPAGTSGVPSDPFGVAPAPAAPAANPFGAPAAPASADPFGVSAAAAPASDPFGAAPASPVSTPPPAPAVMADPFGAADPFGMTTPAPAPAAPAAAAPSAPADPWGMLSAAGSVDFSAAPPPPPPAPPPAAAPVAVAPAAPAAAPSPTVEPPLPTAAPTAPAAPAPAAGDGALYARLLTAMGLSQADMGTKTPDKVADTIGQLLRQTADGLFRLLEARTRVRHQFGVGAQVTTFQRAGNNPLKWTRSPEQALKQMIGDPDRGFLEGTQAVRGAFEDLQAHEMAMMAAMQEAMQETIRRFAPETIRNRISARGWLKSVLPGSREATLWRAYESEFTAFADESEAAYLDLFAKQFKKAYERIVSTTEAKG